jgi:hypothetical protein
VDFEFLLPRSLNQDPLENFSILFSNYQFLQLFIYLFCFTWSTNVSKILRGRLLPEKAADPLKSQALSLHNKYRSKLLKVKQLQN